jgi:hypothetical protein
LKLDGARGRLAEVIARPDTILFIGAGVSAWSGLPTWPNLIGELADFLDHRGLPSHLVRRELDQRDLLQAASFGFDLLTPQDRSSFLRQACRYETATPSLLHKRLSTLGPRAFITTNYDQLLERALRESRPELNFKVVNNTNLIETASIVQSRASDFVFKPHGDIDASDSIILTREQYRELRHERRNAFDAFKTLMSSRPVVFVGFGLRDPDFLLIKDTLAAIYMGAAQDQYAVAPDVDPQEVTYWRNNYGIHLVPYGEISQARDSADRHRGLMALLDEVASPVSANRIRPSVEEDEGAKTLTILRHARRMVQLGPPPEATIFPLAASPYPRQGSIVPTWNTRRPFIEGNAVTGLRNNRSHLLLTGPPGAGKTFVVRAAVSLMAKAVIDGALNENEGVEGEELVPVYVDLRDYSGNLWQVIVDGLPIGFPLDELIEAGRIAFFLDGLNEVATGLIEDNTLNDEIEETLDRIDLCSVVLITRFGEEHTELRLPEVGLESIPRDYVEDEIRAHAPVGAGISEEFITLMERPFFFRLCSDNDLWDKQTPHAVFATFTLRLARRAEAQFGEMGLMDLLGRIAFDAIDAGDLKIPASKLTSALMARSLTADTALEMVNWLLAEEMLIPRDRRELNFFHHSVAEYLAAHYLVSRYREQPETLSYLLSGRRWDQAVLLAIDFLDVDEQRPFFEQVLRTDIELGLRALAFVDVGWEKWTTEALTYLAVVNLGWEDGINAAEALHGIRVAKCHEAWLFKVAQQPESLGGAAMALMLELGGKDYVKRAIDDIFEHPHDYNRCQEIGKGLYWAVDQETFAYALDRIRQLPLDGKAKEELDTEEGRGFVGLGVGLEAAFANIQIDALRIELGPPPTWGPLLSSVISRRLQHDETPEAIELTAELLEVSPHRAAVTLHFQLAHKETPPNISCLDPARHGPALLAAEGNQHDGWALDSLRLLSRFSDEWQMWMSEQAKKDPSGGLRGAALWYAADDDECFLNALEDLQRSGIDWSAEPTKILRMIDGLSWVGYEGLFFDLLRTGDRRLISCLVPPAWSREFRPFFGSIDMADVDWWMELLVDSDPETPFARGGEFLGAAVTEAGLDRLLRLFAEGNEDERRVLAYEVLGHVDGLRLDRLDEGGVTWAVEDLKSTKAEEPEIEESVLAKVATERFVEDVLLAHLKDAQGAFRDNLLTIIRQAGQRHRRRYVATNGEPLR